MSIWDVLALGGGICVTAGVYTLAGTGWALLTAGAGMLIAAYYGARGDGGGA